MTRIYLDNAATTPVLPEVNEAMQSYSMHNFGNANALYAEGKLARQALEETREQVASIVGAKKHEIVFCSGGTEANNALIAGITAAVRQKKGREKGGNHVLCSAFEHHAVLEPVRALKSNGYQVELVKPTREGYIIIENFEAALKAGTVLASIMLAQNEIGSIQPIAELAEAAHRNGTLFHTDAVQALGKIPVDMSSLGVDAASFSAHKLGGPKGVGAMYIKSRTPFNSIILGGGQEGDRRSGTQNVVGAIGFAKALELAESRRLSECLRLAKLRERLATGLLALDDRVSLTLPGNVDDCGIAPAQLPNIVSVLVRGFESETLILKLDAAGIAVSGGSACSTGSLEPSHVLMALGIARDVAQGVLRISLGLQNTTSDVDTFVAVMAKVLRV